MIEYSLIEFEKQLKILQKHKSINAKLDILLKYLSKKVNDKISVEEKEYLYLRINSSTNEKIFDTVAQIIFLYGSFEQFIESLIKEYITNLKRICKRFEELDKVIVKEYFENWKSLHSKLTYPKFSNMNEETMVSSLYSIIINKENRILGECFLQNGGNYKHRIIHDMLLKLGLQDENCLLHRYPDSIGEAVPS